MIHIYVGLEEEEEEEEEEQIKRYWSHTHG
jgi:hypothetical protein